MMILFYTRCVIDFNILLLFFFFFKQKTAYELRISVWSSDVCSSDLEDGDEGETPVTSGAKASPVTRPSELLDAIFAHSRKGLAISRYKGLGEMNARSEERRVGKECVRTCRYRL